MHSPSSQRLRLPHCQPAACTAPEEAAQHPEPCSVLTPSLPRCCQAPGDRSDSWEGQGEPAPAPAALNSCCAAQPTSGGDPRNIPPCPTQDLLGVKGPAEALLPGEGVPIPGSVTLYLNSSQNGGRVVKCPLGPAPGSHLTPVTGPANTAEKRWELHSCRCSPAEAVPTQHAGAGGRPQAPFAHATATCQTGPTIASALCSQICSFKISLQRNESLFWAEPMGCGCPCPVGMPGAGQTWGLSQHMSVKVRVSARTHTHTHHASHSAGRAIWGGKADRRLG